MAGTIAAALTLGATPALADHHLIKIREIFPGTSGNPNLEFVELQMYSGGQENLAPDSTLAFYDSNGVLIDEVPPILDASFGTSQRTFLFGADVVFGVSSDRTYDDDLMNPVGGAVCFESTAVPSPIDCVAWGAIVFPPPSAGAPWPEPITNGSSLVRSIARGCPTLLEAGDDTNQSAGDFSEDATPTPRANSTTPTERVCNTRITKKPPKRTTRRRARFRFIATNGTTEFKCKLDSRPFRSCTSPYRKRVGLGRHTFKVKAEGDSTPARYSWRRVTPD